MKVLKNLTAEVVDEPFQPMGLTRVVDQPVTGFFRQIEFGQAGVCVKIKGGARVAIPLAELLALAERCEPGLIPPKKPVLQLLNGDEEQRV